MNLPDKKTNQYNRYMSEFKGLNRLPVNSEGELSSCQNMIFDLAPVMSVRNGRTVYQTLTGTPQGIISTGDKLAWVLSGTLYYDGVATGLTTLSATGVKSMVEFWGRIFIFPDAKYYNTADGTYGDVGTGTYPDPNSCPSMDYVCVHNNRIWGVGNNTIYASSSGYALGTAAPTICKAVINTIPFASGDYYMNDETNDWIFTVSSEMADKIKKGDIIRLDTGTKRVYLNDNTSAVIDNEATKTSHTTQTLLESVIYNRYGWTQFYDDMGNPDDNGSFFQQVASDGSFTGIIPWDNRIVALKERYHHEIQGSYPSNFTLSTVSRYGTIAHRSAQEVNSKLYYVCPTGVLVYGGGLESDTSRKLNEIYSGAVAGTDGIRYYLCLNNGGSTKKLYVYNTLLDVWTEEDPLDIVDFCQHSGKLYAMCADGRVIIMNDSSSTEEVDWSFEFNDYADNIFMETKVSRLIIKAEGEAGSTMSIKMAVNDGTFETLKTITFPADILQSVSFKATKGQKHTFKIEGTGKINIFGIWYRNEQGGEAIV